MICFKQAALRFSQTHFSVCRTKAAVKEVGARETGATSFAAATFSFQKRLPRIYSKTLLPKKEQRFA